MKHNFWKRLCAHLGSQSVHLAKGGGEDASLYSNDYDCDFEHDGICYKILSFSEFTVRAVTISHLAVEACKGAVCIPGHIEYEGKRLTVLQVGKDFLGGRDWKPRQGVTSVSVDEGVVAIGSAAFGFCGSLHSLKLPDGLEYIGNSLCYNCTSLHTVSVGSGLRRIGQYAFYGCTNLVELHIPDSIEGIGDYAFYGCARFVTVSIGASCKAIGQGAFAECENLQRIDCRAGEPPQCDSEFAGKAYISARLSVPAAALPAYEEAAIWKNFWNKTALSADESARH